MEEYIEVEERKLNEQVENISLTILYPPDPIRKSMFSVAPAKFFPWQTIGDWLRSPEQRLKRAIVRARQRSKLAGKMQDFHEMQYLNARFLRGAQLAWIGRGTGSGAARARLAALAELERCTASPDHVIDCLEITSRVLSKSGRGDEALGVLEQALLTLEHNADFDPLRAFRLRTLKAMAELSKRSPSPTNANTVLVNELRQPPATVADLDLYRLHDWHGQIRKGLNFQVAERKSYETALSHLINSGVRSRREEKRLRREIDRLKSAA